MKKAIRAVILALIFAAPTQLFAQSHKPVVAIYQIEDLANSGQAQTFSAMIETAIESTSKFRVIERGHVNTLLKEQAGAKAGLYTTDKPGKIGGFEGADYLVYGTITTISVTHKADIGSSLLAGMFTPKGSTAPTCSNAFATLGVDIKITDASTGEVKYVTRINETQKSAASCDSVAQVDAALLMRSAADKVATALVTTIYPIQIAAVQPDGVIVLNYGEGAVTPGATMGVFTKGVAIRDPATGEVLGNNEERQGYIQITDVLGRLSKAVAVSGFTTPPQVGAIVRPVSDAELKALHSQPRKHH